jgi:hypothetical protein
MCFPKFCLAVRFFLVLGALALLLPLTVGCGGGKGTVSGTVTLDGQPLPVGNIAFIPSQGPGASGRIEDGKYSVANVPTGPVTVTVETISIKQEIDAYTKAPPSVPRIGTANVSPEMLAKMPENARAQIEKQQKQAAERASKAKELQAKYRAVPEKYSKPESSGLTITVKRGSNTFDIQLSSK